MYALYDDNGDFKVGTILSEADASLQVEALHGKRAKIKASHVLLRFKAPAPGELLLAAQVIADDIDTQFLWEASGEEEFGFESLAREY
ncbi:MAG: RNB domain-containing ribonuclease, partial [Burkholderiales bacterium]